MLIKARASDPSSTCLRFDWHVTGRIDAHTGGNGTGYKRLLSTWDSYKSVWFTWLLGDESIRIEHTLIWEKQLMSWNPLTLCVNWNVTGNHSKLCLPPPVPAPFYINEHIGSPTQSPTGVEENIILQVLLHSQSVNSVKTCDIWNGSGSSTVREMMNPLPLSLCLWSWQYFTMFFTSFWFLPCFQAQPLLTNLCARYPM